MKFSQPLLAFKGDTTIGINPTSYYGIMTFCDKMGHFRVKNKPF